MPNPTQVGRRSTSAYVRADHADLELTGDQGAAYAALGGDDDGWFDTAGFTQLLVDAKAVGADATIQVETKATPNGPAFALELDDGAGSTTTERVLTADTSARLFDGTVIARFVRFRIKGTAGSGNTCSLYIHCE